MRLSIASSKETMREDEIAEPKDELKVCKQQLDAMRNDLEIVVLFSSSVRNSVVAIANQCGQRGFNQEKVKGCQCAQADVHSERVGTGSVMIEEFLFGHLLNQAA
jgi:hypothetical protein